MDGLVFRDVGRLHEVGVDGDATFVLEDPRG